MTKDNALIFCQGKNPLNNLASLVLTRKVSLDTSFLKGVCVQPDTSGEAALSVVKDELEVP